MRIDAHAHLISGAFLETLSRRDLLPFPLPRAELDGLQEMTGRLGIDASLLSPSPPGVAFGDQGLADDLARMLNEELATAVAGDPDRRAALGVLPLPDVDRALEELRYALDVLGLDGVTLFSNARGRYPGDAEFAPLLAELDRRRTLVFLHPTAPASGLALPEHPPWLYEYPFETTRAIVDLLYSGAFERYPSITWLMAHLGGTVPFLAHRIQSLAARDPAAARRAPRGALATLAGLHYETAQSDHPAALGAVDRIAPRSRVLFGTDWPYAALPASGDPAPGLAWYAGDRATIDGGNAARLIPRWTHGADPPH